MLKTFLFNLLVLTGICASNIIGGNLLNNPDFGEFKQQIPNFWGFGNYSGSQAKLMLDNQIFRTDKPAIRIIKTDEKGWCQLIQTVKIKPSVQPRKVKISAWIYSEATNSGSLVVMGESAQKHTVLWKSLKSFSGTFEWEKIEEIVAVPTSTANLTISIRLNQKGLIWVDDCSIEFLDNVSESTNLLTNPEFKGKVDPLTGLPSGWHKKNIEGYESVSVTKLNASVLQMIWKSGGAKFGAEASLQKPLKEGNYIFSAQYRTSGKSQAELSVANYHSEPVNSDSWKTISVIFKANSEKNISPVCWNIGHGEVQYRNFSLQPTNSRIVDTFPIQVLVMPIEITKIWKGKNEFNTFADTPVPLSFEFKGDKNKFKKATLVLEIPIELRIAEAYNVHPGLTQVEIPQIIPVERNGHKFNRCIFTNPRVLGILCKDFAWERKLAIAILPEKKTMLRKDFPIYWYMTADNKKSTEHNFTLRLLPPLPTQTMPVNFPIYCWRLLDINFKSPELLKKVTKGMEKAGLFYRKRSASSRYLDIDAQLRLWGWKFYTTDPDYYELGSSNLKELPSKRKIPMSMNLNGTINKHKMCPSFFNTNQKFKKYLYGFLNKKYLSHKAKNGDPIILDMEPWQPMEWCFCETCRKDFANKNNFKTVPTAKDIISKHADIWSKFRSGQTAESLKIMAGFFRENYPHSKIYIYDYVVDYANPNFHRFFKSVAMDPLLNEKYIDGHFSSYYHYTDKRACDLIDINIKKLKKDYYVVAALDRLGYLDGNEVLSPGRMRMLLLAAAVSGAKGFSVYPGEHFDGLYLQMFNQTMALIGKLENTFREGKRIDEQVNVTPLPYSLKKIKIGNKTKEIIRPNWKDYFVYRAHQNNDDITISLFNYNSEKTLFAQISLKMPSGKYTISNIDSGKRLVPSDKITYWTQKSLTNITAKVAPMDATYLKISRFKPADLSISAITVNSLNREFIYLKSQSDSKEVFKPVSAGALKIDADDIDDDGKMEVSLLSKFQKIWINPSLSGAIIRWQYKGKKLFGWNATVSQNMRILCTERFWIPKAWRSSELSNKYEITKTEILKNTALVELTRKLHDKGLVISKSYRLTNALPTLEVEISIKNIDKIAKEFSFWIHNYLIFGSNNRPSTAILLDLQNGPVKIYNKHQSVFYPSSVGQNLEFTSENLGETIIGNKISMSNVNNNQRLTVQLPLQQIAGVYIWSNTNPTLEWIFKPTVLQPGETWKKKFSLTPFE